MSEPTVPIRVAVVDDQRLFSSGMAMLVESQPDLVCVGTATNGQQAIALVEQEGPDVILMDLRMPVINGLEATRLILEQAPPDGPPRIVALTTIRRDEAVYSALAAGAVAFLTKDAEPEIVLATIRAAHAGAAFPTESSAVDLVREFAAPAASPVPSDVLHDLTGREREIFSLVARGLSNAEIAESEFVSEATVKSHVRSLLSKLGLRSRIQVVIFAYENALVGA
ncbi:DNA-binding response regulator [Frondihabitans sucicola]|uniref:DNA-binding response regulator n=1 Tax=Frondihabitans sucicola TaxID=1268041 RepID=A0ABN6Y7Q4_9MICO|nr:response regulator transcription factor [Frondihabitans sucicola]BDZ51975.1 DNA-binding response regulator [Frondihabitans sucicola]